MTARHALEVLRAEGLLSRHVGRGSFVSSLAGERRLRVIGSVEDMLALGEETRFRLLERAVLRASPGVAAALRIESGTPVARVLGVRLGQAGAFQHVTAYLPEIVGAEVLDADLSDTSVIGSVERRLGLTVTHIDQEVEVVRTPRPVSDLLGAPAGSPILRFRRTYWVEGARPVEHAVTYHRTERYPYRMLLVRSERGTR
jgi:GntR family transcriptional regulator